MAFTQAQTWKLTMEFTVDPSVTLDSVATSGNLIVVALGHRRSDAAATPVLSDDGAGLTLQTNYTDNTNGNKGVALFWGVSDGTEQTFTITAAQRWAYIAVAEFALPTGATGVSWYGQATAVANTAALTLTANVPNPSTSDSLAWVSAFARNTATTSFDSGFATALANGSQTSGRFGVSWRDDAQGTTGNDVTGTWDISAISIMGTGVWTADIPATIAAPTNLSLTAGASSRYLDASWTAASGADSYNVEVDYEGSPGVWTSLTTFNQAGTTFSLDDTDGVDWATTYRCRVQTVVD